MKIVSALSLLLCSVLVVEAKKDFKDPGMIKLKKMQQLAEMSTDGVIEFSVDEYK